MPRAGPVYKLPPQAPNS